MRIKAEFEVITSAVIEIKNAVKIDPGIREYANGQLARYCDPFVPASPALMLAKPVAITEEYVQYRGPYAHYQWNGIVYSPNIPKTKNGILVGFFSPPNKPKTKTDRKLKYSHDTHPLAQAHWDEAAMRRHKGDLCKDVADYIVKKHRGKNDGK